MQFSYEYYIMYMHKYAQACVFVYVSVIPMKNICECLINEKKIKVFSVVYNGH